VSVAHYNESDDLTWSNLDFHRDLSQEKANFMYVITSI
jgi:hypothetical protein